MPYLLGDLDDRQTYHPRKLREARFSGTTYDLYTRRLERAEFIGMPRVPGMGGIGRVAGAIGRTRVSKGIANRVRKVAGAIGRSRIGQAIGRGVKGAIKRVKTGIGMAARTGLGRGIGRVATRATGLVGGAKRMRGVGNAFRSARKFSGPYLLSDMAEFSHSFSERRLSSRQKTRPYLPSRLTR